MKNRCHRRMLFTRCHRLSPQHHAIIAITLITTLSLGTTAWGIMGAINNTPLRHGDTVVEDTIPDTTVDTVQEFMKDFHTALSEEKGSVSSTHYSAPQSDPTVIGTVLKGNRLSPYHRLSPYRPPTTILDAHDGAVIVCDGENDTQFIDPNGNSVTRDTRVAYLIHVSDKSSTIDAVAPHSRVVCDIAHNIR